MVQAVSINIIPACADEGAQIFPVTRELLAQFFRNWPCDASEPALPRAPKHKPLPAAAAELVLA